MNAMVLRTAIAAVVAVTVGAGAYYLKVLGGATKDVTLPERKLEALPMEIGSWKGETTQPDDQRKDDAVGAHETLYRLYRDPAGNGISVHGAVFGEFLRLTPHSPMVCYPANGWTFVEEKDFELPHVEGPPVKVRRATFEMNNRHVFVLFWYQLADQVCYDMDGLAAARRVLRPHCETWPSIVKFLLETSMSDPEEDGARLLDFAGRLYEKTKNLQGTSYLGEAGSTEPSTSSPAGAPAD